MADPVYPNRQPRVSDPLHPSQPLITDPKRELPEHATPSRLGHIPGTPDSRLTSAAESVGSALGSAVSRVRRLPDHLQGAKSRFTVIRGRKQQDVKAAADEAVERVRGAVEDIKQEAQDKFSQAQSRANEMVKQAQDKLVEARVRANEAVHQYPLHVIAGAAAFGMLMGIGLRLWRDNAS